jgi:hypothetical protein
MCNIRARGPLTRSMLRATLITLTAVLLLAAPASARDRCAPRHGEHQAGHRATLTALVAVEKQGYGEIQRLYACVRRTGRRSFLGRAVMDDLDGETIGAVRIAGWRVAWIVSGYDRSSTWNTLNMSDVRRHRHVEPSIDLGHLASWDLGAGGEIAWIADGHVHLWHPQAAPAGDTRIIDTGVALRRVRITGASVHWDHGTVHRRVPLAAPRGHCAASGLGTAQIALVLGTSAVACWRATGRITPLGVALGDYLYANMASADLSHNVDIAGPYVAVTTQSAVIRYDIRDGGALRIPADLAYWPLVDARGELSWTVVHPDITELWVSDGDGLHQIGSTRERAMRDAATIWWESTKSYRMKPVSAA